MNEKIVDMIIQLADTGSTTALWLYGIYVVGTVSKFAIGFGCVYLAVTKFCSTGKEIAKSGIFNPKKG